MSTQTTLIELESRLRKALKADELVLSASTIQLDGIEELLSGLDENGEPKFNAATIEQSAQDKLLLQGKTRVLATDGVNSRFTFSLIDETIVSEFSAQLPTVNTLEFPGLSWLSISKLSLALRTDTTHKIVTGSLSGSINFGDAELPISIAIPVSVDRLRISSVFEQFELKALSDLAALIGDSEFLDLLPPQLSALKGFAIHHFEIDLNPLEKTVSALSLRVGLNQSWSLHPSFEIRNVSFSLKLRDPLLKSKRQTSLRIRGLLHTGSKGDIPIILEKLPAGSEWSLRLEAAYIALPGLAEIAGLLGGEAVLNQLPKGLTRKSALQLAAFEIRLDLAKKSLSQISVAMLCDQVWHVIPNKFSLGKLFGQLDIINPLNAQKRAISGSLSGVMTVAGRQIRVDGSIGETLSLLGRIPQISLSELAEDILRELSLPADLPDFEFIDVDVSVIPQTGEFSISGISPDSWSLPIGLKGIELSDIKLEIHRKLIGSKKQVSGVISAVLNIGSASFVASYNFPGDFVLSGDIPSLNFSPLVQEFCGGELLRGLPMPVSLLSVELSEMSFTIAPQAKMLSLAAQSQFGETEIVIKKIPSKGWGFMAAFVPPSEWKLSTISSDLKALDSIQFDGTTLVLASAADPAYALKTIDSPVAVNRGLNFLAEMDMRGQGPDELLGLEQLRVYAAISGRPSDLVLEAQIDGEFPLGEGLVFGDVTFRLKPAPSDFSLTLLGSIHATLNNQQLKFVAGMQVKPRGFVLQGTMQGQWSDPFDTKGIVMIDVAIELGASFPPLLPTIGIAGGLQVGDVRGSAAVKFDSAMPTRSMIAVEFNRLFLIDILSSFCDPSVVKSIPAAVKKTVLNIGYEDVKLYVVPQPTSIGEIKFEAGTTIQGTMLFFGLRAYAYLNIDYGKGIIVKADVDAIELAGIFSLVGSQGRAKASLLLDLRVGEQAMLDITGAVSLLGVSGETSMRLSSSGFYFKTGGKIFNLFEASIEASGTDLKSGGDFYVIVMMKNDLFAYLREQASQSIQAAASEATGKLTQAQNDINFAQAEVNKLNNTIASTRKIIQAERDRDAKKLRDARAAVQTAQNHLNGIDKNITSMRSTIKAERARDAKRLADAQRTISGAQKEVNRIQSNINSAKKRISTLKSQIKSWKRWYNNLAWYDKSWGWTKLGVETGWRSTEIGAQYAAIGGLETAKWTAIGVLEAAKQVLRGIEQAAKTFPIDADPRMLALFTAKAGANAALETVKLTLRGIEEAIQVIPIDADPRIVGLFVALGTATAGLQTAKLVLEGIKQSIGGLADVSDFIVKAGLGGLLDVRSARFEAYLNAASTGRVLLDLEIEYMGKPSKLRIAFNFNNPLSGALELARVLMPAGSR